MHEIYIHIKTGVLRGKSPKTTNVAAINLNHFHLMTKTLNQHLEHLNVL